MSRRRRGGSKRRKNRQPVPFLPCKADEPASIDGPGDSKSAAVWVDGSAKDGMGPGGWAAIVRYENGYTLRLRGVLLTQEGSDLIELAAVIQVLSKIPPIPHLTVFTDSHNVVSAMTNHIRAWQDNGWRKRDNGELRYPKLWKQLLRQTYRFGRIDWVYVPGHEGVVMHDEVDVLSRQMMKVASHIQEIDESREDG